MTAKNKQSTCFSTTGCFCCREPRLTVHLLMFSKGIYSFTDLKSLTISFLVPWSINIKISPLMRPERNYLGKVVPSFVMEFKTIRDSKGVGAVSADEARRLWDDRCRVTFLSFFHLSIFPQAYFQTQRRPGTNSSLDRTHQTSVTAHQSHPALKLSPAQGYLHNASNVMLLRPLKQRKLYNFSRAEQMHFKHKNILFLE